MIENFIRTRIKFIEEVITQDGYNGADKALWELYGELKIKLKEVPILSPYPETKEETIFKGDPTKLTDEEKAKIKKLVQDGDKPAAISRKLGIPAQRLYYYINIVKKEIGELTNEKVLNIVKEELEHAKSSEQASK